MEDLNMLAADCVVISCCCQCLMFQMIIFFLLKLPCKIARKTKEFALKKLRIRYRKKAEKRIKSVLKGRFECEFVEFHEGPITIQVEEFHGGHGFGSCMEEIESVLGEFSQKGEFAFGSFWGRGESGESSGFVAKQEFDLSLVNFELVEIVNSFRYPN